MSNCPLCNSDPAPNPAQQQPQTTPGGKRPTTLLRRTWRGVQWLFPATLLVLIPKCPMCVAAYIAIFGITISLAAASWIQILAFTFCLLALTYLAVRQILIFRKRYRAA
jgi:hypothetical protein